MSAYGPYRLPAWQNPPPSDLPVASLIFIRQTQELTTYWLAYAGIRRTLALHGWSERTPRLDELVHTLPTPDRGALAEATGASDVLDVLIAHVRQHLRVLYRDLKATGVWDHALAEIALEGLLVGQGAGQDLAGIPCAIEPRIADAPVVWTRVEVS